MTFRLGLTGSIGMGKSSTASIFADFGCAIWDADAAVHRLYGQGGAAVLPMLQEFSEAVQDNTVSRMALKNIILRDKTVLTRLEKIVHPLVRQDREAFSSTAEADILVFDIPLLFETGSDLDMDATACVFVSEAIQKQRVLARGTMTEEELDQILARQMPNQDKCARSTYVIETDSFDHARKQVEDIVDQIKSRS